MNETSGSLGSIETLNNYFNFYYELLQAFIEFDFEKEDFLRNVKRVHFHSYNAEEEAYVAKSDLDYSDEVIRCAYLLKYSVINSYCITEHFQNVYNCDSSLFNQMKEMDKVRICCFGGGSGLEIISICKVISTFLTNDCSEDHQYSIKLYFTIIDVCSEWENWARWLVKKLREFDRDVIDVRMRFLHADLTGKWKEDVLKAVQKADIVTMVKFFSALNLSEVNYEKKKDLKLIEKVAHEMKLNSWIFFLDFAGGGYYKKILDRMKRYQYFQQVQSLLHQKYKVNKSQLEISKSLLPCMYKLVSHVNTTTVSSGTWQKCVPQLKIKRKKPNSVRKTPVASKVSSVSGILEEQIDGILLKEVLKIKDEELDDFYEVPEGQEDPFRVQIMERKNQNKVKEILKKSGLDKKVRIKKGLS